MYNNACRLSFKLLAPTATRTDTQAWPKVLCECGIRTLDVSILCGLATQRPRNQRSLLWTLHILSVFSEPAVRPSRNEKPKLREQGFATKMQDWKREIQAESRQKRFVCLFGITLIRLLEYFGNKISSKTGISDQLVWKGNSQSHPKCSRSFVLVKSVALSWVVLTRSPSMANDWLLSFATRPNTCRIPAT